MGELPLERRVEKALQNIPQVGCRNTKRYEKREQGAITHQTGIFIDYKSAVKRFFRALFWKSGKKYMQTLANKIAAQGNGSLPAPTIREYALEYREGSREVKVIDETLREAYDRHQKY
jgi:hypothetical protein